MCQLNQLTQKGRSNNRKARPMRTIKLGNTMRTIDISKKEKEVFYILEPQRDMSNNPDETMFRPCAVSEATVFALFSRETMNPDEDSEYIGDIMPAAAVALIHKAR